MAAPRVFKFTFLDLNFYFLETILEFPENSAPAENFWGSKGSSTSQPTQKHPTKRTKNKFAIAWNLKKNLMHDLGPKSACKCVCVHEVWSHLPFQSQQKSGGTSGEEVHAMRGQPRGGMVWWCQRNGIPTTRFLSCYILMGAQKTIPARTQVVSFL